MNNDTNVPSSEALSWVPQVKVYNDDTWYGNGMRFPTEKQAKEWAWGLTLRWTQTSGPFRAQPTRDEPNQPAEAQSIEAP